MSHDANTHQYADAVVSAVLDLALRASQRHKAVIGLSGLQGSGKSTLAAQVVAAAHDRGIDALTVSIDDFYLGRAARKKLARDVHPLLKTRGVPGTHDVDLALRTLDALRRASSQHPAYVPRFDKGLDTRLPPSRWKKISHAPRFVILEGWCIGVTPQSANALRHPVNSLERDEDPDAVWRTWVNEQIRAHYLQLWKRFDRLVLLQAPSFRIVEKWRDEQERALRKQGAKHAQSRAALRRFLMHYERLSRHEMKTLPAIADMRIVLDEKRHVQRIVRA
ncbi:MAG TPA: kinase [Rudaea sp.]|jgi:D-glycerate 3-kinase|nr:kinase [Rudaea sp.]